MGGCNGRDYFLYYNIMTKKLGKLIFWSEGRYFLPLLLFAQMGAWLQVCCRLEHFQLLLLFHVVGLSSNLVVFIVFFLYFFTSVVVLGFFMLLLVFVLLVGFCTMIYVIFAALVIGFGLCCVIDLVSFQLGLEVFQWYDFQRSLCYSAKKKRKEIFSLFLFIYFFLSYGYFGNFKLC